MAPSASSFATTEQHVGQLSPFVCACFTLNYIIGTGFLTLPWAFETGGIVLGRRRGPRVPHFGHGRRLHLVCHGPCRCLGRGAR